MFVAFPNVVKNRVNFQTHCVLLESLINSAKILHVTAANEDTNSPSFTCAANAFHSPTLFDFTWKRDYFSWWPGSTSSR